MSHREPRSDGADRARRRPAIAIALALAAAGAAWPGCAGSLNTSTRVGGAVTLGTLAPPDAVLHPRESYPPPPGPSLRGISRANWSEQVFLVPVDGAEHYAASSVHPRCTDQNLRQGAGFPTEHSTLESTTPASAFQQTLEAIAEPFYCGLDIVMALPRAVFDPPWTVQRSPRRALERAPAYDRPPVVPIDSIPSAADPEAPRP
jgi:hypothetical protein